MRERLDRGIVRVSSPAALRVLQELLGVDGLEPPTLSRNKRDALSTEPSARGQGAPVSYRRPRAHRASGRGMRSAAAARWWRLVLRDPPARVAVSFLNHFVRKPDSSTNQRTFPRMTGDCVQWSSVASRATQVLSRERPAWSIALISQPRSDASRLLQAKDSCTADSRELYRSSDWASIRIGEQRDEAVSDSFCRRGPHRHGGL